MSSNRDEGLKKLDLAYQNEFLVLLNAYDTIRPLYERKEVDAKESKLFLRHLERIGKIMGIVVSSEESKILLPEGMPDDSQKITSEKLLKEYIAGSILDFLKKIVTNLSNILDPAKKNLNKEEQTRFVNNMKALNELAIKCGSDYWNSLVKLLEKELPQQKKLIDELQFKQILVHQSPAALEELYQQFIAPNKNAFTQFIADFNQKLEHRTPHTDSLHRTSASEKQKEDMHALMSELKDIAKKSVMMQNTLQAKNEIQYCLMKFYIDKYIHSHNITGLHHALDHIENAIHYASGLDMKDNKKFDKMDLFALSHISVSEDKETKEDTRLLAAVAQLDPVVRNDIVQQIFRSVLSALCNACTSKKPDAFKQPFINGMRIMNRAGKACVDDWKKCCKVLDEKGIQGVNLMADYLDKNDKDYEKLFLSLYSKKKDDNTFVGKAAMSFRLS